MSELLVVSATRAETTHVPDDVEVVVCGIGKTAAATAVASALATRDTTDLVVINLGSAGALRPGLTGVYEPGVVLNHDLSADAIRALGHDPREVIELLGGDGTVLATGDQFVADTTVRDRLAERAHLVDMEGYAVAYACAEAGVECHLVKHVSDQADEGAREWASLVDTSARRLAEWLEHFRSRRG